MIKLAYFRTVIVGILLVMLLGGATAQAASMPTATQAAAKYDPGIKLYRTCTYTSSRGTTTVTGVTLSARFDNRASTVPMGYEASLVNVSGKKLAGASKYLKKGKQGTWFTLVAKNTLPSDEQLFLSVSANDTEFAHYDFTRASLCGNFAMHSVWNGGLKSTVASTCILRLSVKNEQCAWIKNTLTVKNLGSKKVKIVVRSKYTGINGGGDGPTKTVNIASKKSYTFELVRHTAGKRWCYVGKCSKAFGEASRFDMETSGEEEIGLIDWTYNDVDAWTGLGLSMESES